MCNDDWYNWIFGAALVAGIVLFGLVMWGLVELFVWLHGVFTPAAVVADAQ